MKNIKQEIEAVRTYSRDDMVKCSKCGRMAASRKGERFVGNRRVEYFFCANCNDLTIKRYWFGNTATSSLKDVDKEIVKELEKAANDAIASPEKSSTPELDEALSRLLAASARRILEAYDEQEQLQQEQLQQEQRLSVREPIVPRNNIEEDLDMREGLTHPLDKRSEKSKKNDQVRMAAEMEERMTKKKTVFESGGLSKG